MKKKKAFTLLELIILLSFISITLSLNFSCLKSYICKSHLDAKTEIKILITDINYFKSNYRIASLIFPGDGRVIIRSDKMMKTFDNPRLRFFVSKGVYKEFIINEKFMYEKNTGENGSTINLFKKDKLVARLIFNVGTSQIREEYFEN